MSETIVFFGSGPVAAAALELLSQNFNIEAVITKPQPESHKYLFPVIATTQKLNLKTYYASNKKELSDLITKSKFKSRAGVVIDFGIIIARDVIDYFPLGIINSHFSLLPKFRGADPISFALLNGNQKTGVSLMLINEALDEGELLDQCTLIIAKDMISPELTDKLINLSNDMLNSILPLYFLGKVKPYPQSGQPTYSRKLAKTDGTIDFNKPAIQLEREVRTFIEWPKSSINLKNIKVIVTKSHIKKGSGKPGAIFQDNKELGFYTLENILMIDRLIPEGKKEMSIEAFLAGYK